MLQATMILPLVLTTLVTVANASPLEPNKRLDNGLGKTPALGWNSWNVGGCSTATAANALTAAKAFVNLGLKDLGYSYVNIDDCWANKNRNSNGDMVADPSKWPNGIKSVADQIHGMGLKFGLYGCSGTQTCAGYPGSQGNEVRDAKLLASWGVDYWKYDNCYTPSGNSSGRFMRMRDALAGSGWPIFYSMCQWGNDAVWTWGRSVGNSWRTTGDITNDWASAAKIGAHAGTIAGFAGPGGFNDLDMMEIGNGGLSAAEERTHFGLWCIAKSPIILGTDLSKISASSLKIIKTAGLLAINQDPLGKAAAPFKPSGKPAPVSGKLYPYWAGPLSDGVVIGLIAVDAAATLSVSFADVPGLGAGTYNWTEVYGGTTGSGTSVSASLGLHDMAVFKVTKV
ncbi:(Trans)glycosidase [Glarea lozoyensis ATCC 20868]|uniref:Alpha-galactosidase n=1 Tax=Glarea lozoyensis (strain ATCC 20868 / MF5171) TaxID=1116229 RepID=S3E284_GLAL2|nr:(Trans)glycosidase [Glarea lozoyensis ATCC 20868]EPE32583.1 (Trans)glycosidase [Glarea lozoyensis ATCC 20868]